jgi:hypothetical protein
MYSFSADPGWFKASSNADTRFADIGWMSANVILQWYKEGHFSIQYKDQI